MDGRVWELAWDVVSVGSSASRVGHGGGFDIVGYDACGIGRSHPVLCSADLLASEPAPVPANQAEFAGRVVFNQRLRADCRARTGPLFDHVDTLSGVRDGRTMLQ